ncbi:MAG TPA: hypothetical protein DEB39_13990 [Planctomycetaceae bacterium]|nr:hypothetical protein [Planctomycetaceae bacterium]
MSLATFSVNGAVLDSLDLKVTLLSHGMHVHDDVYESFGTTHRISRDPRSCNTLFLGDHVPVYLARIGKEARFHLIVSEGRPVLTHDGNFVTEVSLPPGTEFYAQRTSSGLPFGRLAILQGLDMLAFSYLWPCELAKSINQCRFCHSGNTTSQMVQAETWQDFDFSVRDIVDVVRYAVDEDPKAKILQMTAGSTFRPDAEINRYVAILADIERRVGLAKVDGGILFLTPPSDPTTLDRLIDAGAGRLAFDMDVWDETLFEKYCPGKAKYTTRRQHLDALLYVADKYGPNRAFSVFVAGLEPLDSLLEGMRFLAENGIVPLPSPWMPFGVANPELPPTPGLDYYRQLRKEVASLYRTYGLEAPGTVGSSVCLSRDIWLRRDVLAAETSVGNKCPEPF